MNLNQDLPSVIECPTCRQRFDGERSSYEQRFDVYKASCSSELRKSAAGFWMVENFAPMLVAECSEDEEEFVQAIMLADYDEPGFCIVEFANAEYRGKARVKVSNRGRGNLSPPLGQLYVRNGHAGISYLSGSVVLLEVALAGAENVPDGNYGFNWDLECSQDGAAWRTVYQADESKTWLNAWRPLGHEILSQLPSELRALESEATRQC